MAPNFDKVARPPKGSRLVMLYSDYLSNIYSVFENDGSYMMVYDPMTPIRSCSGKYSGGNPFLKEISEEEYAELKNAFDDLAQQRENHTFDRSKPAGLFTSQTDKFIVRNGCYDEFERAINKHTGEKEKDHELPMTQVLDV